MAKVDFSKDEITEIGKNIPVHKRSEKADKYISYEKACMELIREYKDEVAFIKNWGDELRKERNVFHNNKIKEMMKAMTEAGLPKEDAKAWITELRNHYMRSIEISEKLLNDFSMDTISQMKNKLRELLK